jgi:hypothetical protein
MSNSQNCLLDTCIQNLNKIFKFFTSQTFLNSHFERCYPDFLQYMSNRRRILNSEGINQVYPKRQVGINIQSQSNQTIVTSSTQEISAEHKIKEKREEKEFKETKDGIFDVKEKNSESQISTRECQNEPLFKATLSHKRYRCKLEQCEKSFYKKSQWVEHLKGHTPPNYQCPFKYCNSSFNYLENLEKHKKIHDQKKYKCPTPGCGKSFSNLFNYQVRSINFKIF